MEEKADYIEIFWKHLRYLWKMTNTERIIDKNNENLPAGRLLRGSGEKGVKNISKKMKKI